MIAPMKKVTLVILSAAASEALEVLRRVGVVHVEFVRRPESADVESTRSEMELVERALRLLPSMRMRLDEEKEVPPIETAKRVLALFEEQARLRDRLSAVEVEIERLAPLGNFDPQDFQRLKEMGIVAKLYRCHKKDLNKAELKVPCEIVAAKGAGRYLLAVSDADFHLPLDEMAIPERGLAHLEGERDDLVERLEEVEHQREDLAHCASSLQEALRSLGERLEFAEVLSAMGSEERLSYLRGYCPADEVARLKEAGEITSWGIVVEDPAEEDDVPTLIRNPSWIRIIEPVFRLMGTVPGYKEYDVSFWFLASLCLFFAMLVGDGGYGLLFLAGTYLLQRKFGSVPGAPFPLLYLFSVATVVWGLITGTWFGVEALAGLPFLSDFIVSSLYSYSENQDFMFHLCFLIGSVHLTIAHIIRMIRYLNSSRAMAELGWILMIWFLYFLAESLVMGRSFPSAAIYLFPAGVLLTSFFSNPKGNFFKSFFLALTDLPLNIVRAFSDVVSYIRLFAVSYATLIVAVSFNQMAADLGWAGAVSALGALAILLIGHALNITLAGMAVLVHGVRLNMLEFSSHLEMTWSGRRFTPFRRQTAEEDVHGSLDVREAGSFSKRRLGG